MWIHIYSFMNECDFEDSNLIRFKFDSIHSIQFKLVEVLMKFQPTKEMNQAKFQIQRHRNMSNITSNALRTGKVTKENCSHDSSEILNARHTTFHVKLRNAIDSLF